MNFIVQKFGGTSVSTKENRQHCFQHIQRELKNGYKVAVVVSAMGRNGDPYATDTLLSLIGDNTSLDGRQKDLLVSTGEIISAATFTNELRQLGISATFLTGGQAGIITDNEFESANIIELKNDRLLTEFADHDVLVIAGFQGMTSTFETTTLGRGGSDTSASLIGANLSASSIDIFTDVEGVMSADPRIVAKAKILDRISYLEVSQLAHQGAKVIHPRAVKVAMDHSIPLRVRSTFLKSEGTLITSLTEIETQNNGPVVGITHTSPLVYLTIQKEAFQNVFSLFSSIGLSIDFINVSDSTASFTIPLAAYHKHQQSIDDLPFSVTVSEKKMAKIAVVGDGIFGRVGIFSDCISALYSNEINVYQSADSHTTLWFLVEEDRVKEGVQALHQAFFG